MGGNEDTRDAVTYLIPIFSRHYLGTAQTGDCNSETFPTGCVAASVCQTSVQNSVLQRAEARYTECTEVSTLGPVREHLPCMQKARGSVPSISR